MTEVPKIVCDRLLAAALDQSSSTKNAADSTHPDADVLTAFAEQSLSASEREGVLDHLVLCENCRDIVALALPTETVGAIPISAEGVTIHDQISRAPKPVTHRIFAWPSLRWAALAACVVVVGSVFLLRLGKLNPTMRRSASQQIVPSAAPSSASGAPTSAQTNLASGTPQSKEAPPLKYTARQALSPSPQAESAMLLARNKKSPQRADKLANMPGGLALDESEGGETGRAATETAEVSAAASEVSPSPDATLTARNEAPAIEKAKPALQGATTEANGLLASEANQPQGTNPAVAPMLQARARSSAKLTVSASPTSAASFAQRHLAWAIRAGVLQRSPDDGQTWQDSLRADHPLLCYASHGKEIWTGGQGGTLYHSTDGGVTWVQAHPSADIRQLTADVSQIDLRNSSAGSDNLQGNGAQTSIEVVVSTSNKESWTSLDGGKSWKAK